MNIVFWILQISIAIKFLSVSDSHSLRQDKDEMKQAIHNMGSFARPTLFITALVSFLGSVGLILPAIMGVTSWITPLFALLLALMTLVSILLHIKYRERPKMFASIILFAICAFFGIWQKFSLSIITVS